MIKHKAITSLWKEKKYRCGMKNRDKKAYFIIRENNKIEKTNRKLMKKIKMKFISEPVKNALYCYNKENNSYISMNHSKDLLVRLTLNYLRHTHTNYDNIVSSVLHTKDSIDFKKNVNSKILRRYDCFKDELGEIDANCLDIYQLENHDF